MVRILGGNFREGPNPLNGDTPQEVVSPTVKVTFGGEPAEYVVVVNHALIYVRTPAAAQVDAKTGASTGAVDVVVTNLDDDGEPIVGEACTVTGGFTYADAKLTTESDLARVVRAILRELRKQVVREVVLAPHTDYDASTEDGLNIVETAELPALALIGPELVENRFYSSNVQDYIEGHDHSVQTRDAHVVDVAFQLVGMADKTVSLINLQAAVISFFKRNCYLKMLCDPNDASQGYATFEIVLVRNAGVDVTLPGDDANVKSFSTRFLLRGFPIRGVAGFDGILSNAAAITEMTLDDDDAIVLQTEAL